MNVCVVGGGPAGMLAAVRAARSGHSVTLIEQNEKLGKKLFITGKGRCNVTNTAERELFFANVAKNPRFLYSAFHGYDNRAVMDFFEQQGVPLKTERGGRVFPASDKSSDILRALENAVKDSGVSVQLNTRVSGVVTRGDEVAGVLTSEGTFPCQAIVIATGGMSYPATGSTGDGYRFAESLGHTIVPPVGSLVPFETVERWPAQLSGLTLKNVTLSAYRGGRRIYEEMGEMLFTHFGVSGPLVLTLSTLICEEPKGTKLFIDLKPALGNAVLEKRILRDLSDNPKKQAATALHALLPARLLAIVLQQADIQPDLPVSELTKLQRRRLVTALKELPLTVRCARPIAEAIVTRGGVDVSEVDASTMASKLVHGLYFAGEILNVDAKTGGFNLQIAWSTGALAGQLITPAARAKKNAARGEALWSV